MKRYIFFIVSVCIAGLFFGTVHAAEPTSAQLWAAYNKGFTGSNDFTNQAKVTTNIYAFNMYASEKEKERVRLYVDSIDGFDGEYVAEQFGVVVRKEVESRIESYFANSKKPTQNTGKSAERTIFEGRYMTQQERVDNALLSDAELYTKYRESGLVRHDGGTDPIFPENLNTNGGGNNGGTGGGNNSGSNNTSSQPPPPDDPNDLVPCNGPDCQTCDLVTLANNGIRWFITVASSIIAIIFAWGGIEMVMSKGEGISEARSKMTNAIIGFIILLSAWLIVDTFLKLLVGKEEESKLGPWHTIDCAAQPQGGGDSGGSGARDSWNPVDDGSRGVSPSSPNASTLGAAKARVNTYKDQMCATASSAGIGGECASLLAIMTQESGGNPNAISSKGAVGLMQIMPSAARDLDPSLAGLSDAEVRQRLLDPAYNMKLGTEYYKNSISRYGVSDYDSIYASYNGGYRATAPSRDCPGQERWQCVWDSPGCYGTERTDCTPNVGYRETRNYVRIVNSYRQQYAQ